MPTPKISFAVIFVRKTHASFLKSQIEPCGTPNTPTKDTNKVSDIVLNDIRKDLMRHVNSEVENLKGLIDNEFNYYKKIYRRFREKKTLLLKTCHL